MVNIIKPEEPLEIVIRITKGKIISSIIVTLFLLYIIYKYLIKDKKQDLYETTHNERRFDAAKKEHEKIIQIKNIPSSVEINDNKVNGSIVQKLPKINDSLEKDKKELIKNNKENLHTQQQTHISEVFQLLSHPFPRFFHFFWRKKLLLWEKFFLMEKNKQKNRKLLVRMNNSKLEW